MQNVFEEIIEKLEEKIKVTSLEIIVTGTKDKPYFEIKYKEVGKKDYSIGYSSYDLNNVFEWKEECFEIVNQVAEECKSTEHVNCSTDKSISHGNDDLVIDSSHSNDGWIPCSSGIMPDYGKSVLISFNSDFQPLIATLYEDNTWKMLQGVNGLVDITEKVIAWQNLPQPYQPKGE